MGNADKNARDVHEDGEDIKVTIEPKPRKDKSHEDKDADAKVEADDTPTSAWDNEKASFDGDSFEEELGRIEGIESDSLSKASDAKDDDEKEEIVAEPTSDDFADVSTADDVSKSEDDDVNAPVDLDKVMEEAKRDNPIVQEIRAEGQKKKKRRGVTVALVLCVLLALGAGGAAAYYFIEADSARSDSASAQSDLKLAQDQIKTLESHLAVAEDELAAQDGANDGQIKSSADDGYREIAEIGVRFKETEATKGLLFAYIASNVDAAADSVAISTKPLVKLSVGEGASVAYPCAFSGNVPTITRFTTDVQIDGKPVSEVGKKIGDAFFVYTAPAGNCAPSEEAAQQARNDASKAVFDALEALAATEESTTDQAAE